MTVPKRADGFVFTGCLPTRYKGLYVWHQDPTLWRFVAIDATGSADLTGPQCRSKAEAMGELANVHAEFFGNSASKIEVERGAREQIVLVAFDVYGDSPQHAQQVVMRQLGHVRDTGEVDSWWIAEDNRHDGSDCDSAVFVKPGRQREARDLLRAHGLA